MSDGPSCPECRTAIQPDWDFCHACGFDPEGKRPDDWRPGASEPDLPAPPPPPPPAPPSGADATPSLAARMARHGGPVPEGAVPEGPAAGTSAGGGPPPPAAPPDAPTPPAATPASGSSGANQITISSRTLMIAGAVVLVLIVGMVAFLATRKSDDTATTDTAAAGTTTTKATPPPLGAIAMGGNSSSTVGSRAGWKEWEPPGNPFTVKLPGQVNTQARVLSWGPGAKTLVVGTVETAPKQGYLLAYIDLMAGDPTDIQSVAAEFFTSFNKSGNADLGVDSDMTFEGYPAVKIVGSVDGTPARGVALVRNNRFYMLIGIGITDEDYQFFVDSFEFE